MRFILAAVAFVASVVALVVGGIQFVGAAQATTVTADGTTDSGAPVIVINDDVFSSRAGLQDIRIEGDGAINVIIGRTSDIEAWVGDARHDEVTLDEDSTHSREHIGLKFTESGTEETVPNPIGNDLWYEEHEGEGSVQLSTVVAPGYSMLITSNGDNPAPSTVSVTWPLGGYAPMSGPLLVIGAVLFVLALALLWWALAHRRRVKRQLASATRKRGRSAAVAAAGADANGEWSVVPWYDEVAEAAQLRADNVAAGGELVVDEDAPIEFPVEPATAPVPVSPEPVVTEPVASEPAVAGPVVEAVEEPPVEATAFDEPSDVAASTEEVPVVEDTAEPVEPVEPELADAPNSAFAPPSEASSDTWTAAELGDASEPVVEPEPEETVSHDDVEPEPEPEPEPESAPAPEVPAAPASDDDSKWRRPRGRNRSSAPRRSFLIAPVAMVVGLTLAGCAPQYWPAEWTNAELQPTGTATSTVDAALLDEGAHPPALNMEQIQNVVTEAADLANQADGELDASVLEPRFEGDALAERIALYKAKKADSELPSPAAFPTGDVVYAVPESTDEFPRTIFVVVNANADASEAPFGVMLVQDTARDNFKVASLTQLAANVSLPESAPTSIGSASIRDLPGDLVVAPSDLAGAYADVIANGSDSQYASLFSADNDTLRSQVNQEYRDAQTEALDPEATDVEFKYEGTDTAPLGMVSLDDGAIIAVSINEIETVSAANDRARITVSGATAALSGIETTEYGFTRTYTDQLLFYVPSAETGGEVQFLGVSQAMTSASELSE
ncbi:hypothetical protein [Gulosibacter sediminis]|uniref:hypothetical protein n=1 Tax=Gulosibacter sediminis TaxID=1729695 RepID=UPI0024A9DFE7|nr:hypothetical protein [Gulosibacter sediminis]